MAPQAQRVTSGVLRLHPDNPHYFLFRGKPTVLVTSGEHYGAVLNRAFDYAKYLDAQHCAGLNLTRIFTGAYVEPEWEPNTNPLAPGEGQLICPWKRSAVPGYRGGGMRFDLHAWDPDYFARLTSFVRMASERGIVVEVCLFSQFYDDSYGDVNWVLSPWHPDNNTNGINVPVSDVYALGKNGELGAVQDAMVRKIVTELNGFDNVYYEICNEPREHGAWQAHIAEVITTTEAGLPNRHLVSANYYPHNQPVRDLPPGISIINFHYASPPDGMEANYALNRALGQNETLPWPEKGSAIAPHRREGWEFLLAGGALHNNLDLSFQVGREQGDIGSDNPLAALYQQLRLLKEFMHSLDLPAMRPDKSSLRGGLNEGQRAQVLSEPSRQYAIYVFGGSQVTLRLDLPEGEYRAEWVNPTTGRTDHGEDVMHAGGEVSLTSPGYVEDIALRLRRSPSAGRGSADAP